MNEPINITTSWKISSPFDEEVHLFKNILHTNYNLESYYCHCGEIKNIITNPNQSFQYECTECGNQKFYDTHLLMKDYYDFVDRLNFDFDPKLEFEEAFIDGEAIVSYYFQIPSCYDFASDTTTYIKKRIFQATINQSGTFTYFYKIDPLEKSHIPYLPIKDKEYKPDDSIEWDDEPYEIASKDLELSLKTKLVAFIKKNNIFNINRIENHHNLSDAQLLFYIKYKDIVDEKLFAVRDDIDIIYNNHPILTLEDVFSAIRNKQNTKALKKAIYQNYLHQVENTKIFRIHLIYTYCLELNDTNVITNLIGLHLENTFEIEFEQISLFIKFLKVHYNEKLIYNLLKQYISKKNPLIFKDSAQMITMFTNEQLSKFRKTKCNIDKIHNELIRVSFYLSILDQYDVKFNYNHLANIHCIQLEDYQVALPLDGETLHTWASSLNNCLMSYFDRINNNETIIYGFFKNGNIKFSVEIRDGKIIQSSGNYNRDLHTFEKNVLNVWHNNFNPRIETFKKHKTNKMTQKKQ